MLIIRDVILFHTQVEVLLASFDQLAPNYQLIVIREGIMDRVKLDVEFSKFTSVSLNKELTDTPVILQL